MITSIKVKALRLVNLPRRPVQPEASASVPEAEGMERGRDTTGPPEPTAAGLLEIAVVVRDKSPVSSPDRWYLTRIQVYSSRFSEAGPS